MNSPLATTQDILVSLLRASALSLAFTCPASIRESSIRINGSNIMAVTGSAEHKIVETLPATGLIDYESIDVIADQYGVDSNELRYLASKAKQLWDKVKDSFPNALTEVAVEHTLNVSGLRITGHLDGVSITGDVARIYDWKFGRLDSDYYHQMMAYASMILLEYPSIQLATVTILWARDGEVENYTVTRYDAEAWAARLESEVIAWDGVYHPSEKCVYCPRSHECAAFNALARSYSAAILDVDTDTLESKLLAMPPQQVIELKRKAKTVRLIAEKAEEAIRNVLIKQGEIIGDDAKLVLDNQPRSDLDPIKTAEIVGEEFSFDEDDWRLTTKVRSTELYKLIGQKAGHGNGAAAIRGIKDKLERRGALQMVDVLTVKEKRL